MAEPTSEDIKNMTSAMADFTKAIKENNKQWLKTGNTVQNIAKEINDSNKTLEKDVNKNLTGTQKAVKAIGESIHDIASSVTGLGKILGAGALAGFFTNLVKDAIRLDNEMTKLSMQMGKGKEGIKELKGAVNGLQKEFGASYEEASNLVAALSEAKYVGNIKEAAAAINLFSRATGTSSSSALQLTNVLSKGAGLSDKAITAMYAGMTKVQQKVGISKAGMEALTSSIQQAAVSMVAMGKTGGDIQKVTNNMTALVGALEKVGVSAQESTQLIGQLLDPDRIEDNIMLYSQLGISMEDALSGNINLDGMDNQLKEMAQRIVDMGPIAGSQFAKSMGMSYKQATQMAKMESGAMGEVADAAQTSEEQALDTLKDLNSQTEAIFEKANRGLNKIEGVLRGLPGVLLIAMPVVISKIKDMLANGFKEAFSPKQMSVATEAAVDTMVNGFKKGFEKTEIQTRTFFGSFGDAIHRTWVGDVETFFTNVDKKTEALVAKAQRKNFTAAFFDASAKNRIDSYLKNFDDLKVKVQDQVKLYGELEKAKKQAVGNRDNRTAGKIEEQMKKIAVQIKEITGLNIDAGVENIAKSVNELTISSDKVTGQMKVWSDKYLKTNKEAALYNDKLNEANKNLQDLVKKQEDKSNAEAASLAAAKEIAEIDKQIAEARDANVKGILEGEKKKKQLVLETNKETLKTIQQELKGKSLEDEITKAKKAQADAQKKFNKALEETNKGPLSATLNLVHGIGNTIAAKWNTSKLGQAIANNGGGFKGVAKTAGKGIAKGAVAAGKGTLKAIGGITKMLGPWAIVMALIGKVLDKIKEPLNNLLDNLMVKLQPVLDVIMPIVSELLNTLVKTLFPPLLNILGVILTVLRYILKPVQLILKALSHLPVVGKAFEGINKSIDQITGPEVVGALKNAAETIANSSEDLTQAVDKKTDQENQPKVLEAQGAKFVETQTGTNNTSTSTPAASSAASSITTTTKEVKSDEEKMKESDQISREKKQLSLMEDLRDELWDPAVTMSIKQLLAQLVDLFKNNNQTINTTAINGPKNTLTLEESAVTSMTGES